jgi:hypothetical protein
VPGGFSHREEGHGGGGSRDFGEVEASPGSKSGKEATNASKEAFPPPNRAQVRPEGTHR